MSKDKMILIIVVAIATLVLAPKLRQLPGVNKIPTL